MSEREKGPKDVGVFDMGNPPTDERGNAQYKSTIKILEAMVKAADEFGAHHAANGAMGAIFNFVEIIETAHPDVRKSGLFRKIAAAAMRDAATKLEQFVIPAASETKQ